MTVLYPWGYQRALVSEDRLWELARFDLVDPETGDRFKAYIRSKNGEMGIGGAIRFVQPDRYGFAPEGKSFHQLQEFADHGENFAALDLVMRNGANVHRAPTWAEVPKQGTAHADIWDYGVHANVSGEPWHLQPIEIDGWQTWVNNGRRRPNPDFPIKGYTPPTPPPSDGWNFPLGSRTLRMAAPTMRGSDVMWVQQLLRDKGKLTISVDGIYGRQSVDRVKTFQGWNNLKQDGVVGPITWAEMLKSL